MIRKGPNYYFYGCDGAAGVQPDFTNFEKLQELGTFYNDLTPDFAAVGLRFPVFNETAPLVAQIRRSAERIGEALYQAKIFFSTPELFAWTLAIILISLMLEKAVMRILGLLRRRMEAA